MEEEEEVVVLLVLVPMEEAVVQRVLPALRLLCPAGRQAREMMPHH